MLRPADDYVANFVREVNRGRVIHVEAIMDPIDTATTTTGPTIPAETTIEDAVRILSAANATQATVTDQTGKTVGTASFIKLVNALVTPRHDGAVAITGPAKVGATA
ncbi:hypothetical protein ASG68_27805 [Rhizobium sp. Leaf453]|nr:hypothetical protein ASG68_27805 [Rhizobium sp. Leaf453]